jgi:hypothetical protein
LQILIPFSRAVRYPEVAQKMMVSHLILLGRMLSLLILNS